MLNVPDTASSGSATGNPRNKVALKKGRGLMDWVRLGHTVPDLAGTGGKLLKITPDELSKHNKRDDAWIALKGKVYNVTPYFEFHPGGEEELMKGVGIDATDLFNQVHKWVNFQSMLQKCLVGTLEESKSFFTKPNFLPLKKSSKSAEIIKDNGLFPSSSSSFSLLSSNSSSGKSSSVRFPKIDVKLPPPKYDWFQTKAIINIAIYTKWKDIRKWHVIVVNHEKYLKTLVYIREDVFTVHLELLHKVERDFELKIGNESGKVDILLKKVEHGLRWCSIGKSLPGNNDVDSSKNKEVEYVPLEICEKTQITHNSYLIELQVPHFVHFEVPVGHHVYLRIPDSNIVKPYTPIVTPFLVQNKSSGSKCNQNIKIYFKVYPDGSMTPELNEIPVGKRLHVSFPEGSFSMKKFFQATLHATHLVLLGAGTGITPLIRLMLEALKNEVKTLFVLFNRTVDDIPWKAELDAVVVTHPKLFRVSHVLSNPSSVWKSFKGHIRRDLLEELLPTILPIMGEDSEESPFIAICGPNPFTKLGLSLLEEMGCSSENIFAFTG